MTLHPCASFWDYREHVRHLMRPDAAVRAADPAERYTADRGPSQIDERLIQTIWAHQFLHTEGLRTAGGERLRVLEPGRWNGGAGPDFRDARLMIGSETRQGDVEVHVAASDWDRHGHARDFDYNGVILHAVLRIDDERPADPLHNGAAAPRLELEPYIFPDLETLRRSLSPDDYEYARPAYLGRCHEIMAGGDAAVVADLLDRAGDERLLAKMRRLDDQTPHGDLEQVFYQALMMALGAGPGKTLYYLLAKRTPLAEMMDYARELDAAQWPTALEALLLHVGGLVPEDESLSTKAPEAARERADRLRTQWRRLEPYWSDRAIPPTQRWFQGIRPVNFPVRRLAGVAALLARAMRSGKMPLADLTERLHAGARGLESARPARKRHPLLVDLVEWFKVGGEGHFWGTHYSFAAKPSARAMDLIGDATALSLAFNALLPAALLAARRADDEELATAVQRLYALFPPLQPNHITEFMTLRLFGEGKRASQLITTERRRQALFQIFHACCQGQELHCDACYYLNPKP
jgi:hypothetical protein